MRSDTVHGCGGSRTTLTILGPALQAVSVFISGGSTTPPRQIFAGTLPASERLRLRVPRAVLRVVAGAREAIVDCQTDVRANCPARCVDLRHRNTPK